MSVKFTIRGNDIRRLRSALDRDRHPERDRRWFVFLQVAPSVATFQFGNTTVEYPIDGKSPGFAKFSEEILLEASSEFSHKTPPHEVSIEIREGHLRCDQGYGNGEIEVGYIRTPLSNRVVYLRDVELAALDGLLADTTVQGVDLQPLITEASDSISSSISSAYGDLEKCGFQYEEVRDLVQARIAEIRQRLKERFGNLGLFTWKS